MNEKLDYYKFLNNIYIFVFNTTRFKLQCRYVTCLTGPPVLSVDSLLISLVKEFSSAMSKRWVLIREDVDTRVPWSSTDFISRVVFRY